MNELLLFCLTVSLACTAIHVAVTWDGMILNKVKVLAEFLDWSEYATKPLYGCLICMSSFWTVFFWLCYIKPITFELLFAVLITCGINVVVRCIINQMTELNEW